MIEHPLKHAGEAVPRHGLVSISEIAVIAIGAGRHPRRYLRIEFRGIKPPLLARIATEKFLIKLASDRADNHVLGSAERVFWLGPLGQKLGHLERVQFEAVESVDGIQVDRNRNQLPIDAGKHLVLILSPLRKSG